MKHKTEHRKNCNYVSYILALYSKTIETLVNEGVPREIIDFQYGYKKPRRPTAAFSDFLINRQLGDWTESLFRIEINRRLDKFKVLKYGAGGHLVAGDPEFKNFFSKYHEEILEIGKRPDLLFYKKETINEFNLPDDISEMDQSKLSEIAKLAIAGIEVRSSRYYVSKYREAKGKEQSFTTKLEDIPIVTHWVIKHKVPCFYTQIFFDEAHIISFEEILKIIRETGIGYIRKMEKNQRKSTFYIPISKGLLVGKIYEPPTWKAEAKVLDDGRVIPYVTPQGGKMDIDVDLLIGYMNRSQKKYRARFRKGFSRDYLEKKRLES